ncbi:GNAT family N-acetyltransferase [Ekhidna sp.]|uniref:GNAT family N-acetyltransferase n=1 Tax=Ekhidna sp. TaxID=2608089 RepID=UPI00351154AA
MSFLINQPIEEVTSGIDLVYFKSAYFQTQIYNHLFSFADDDFFVAFDITPEKAISIPRSPFGSFFRRNSETQSVSDFAGKVFSELKKNGVSRVEIHHPSAIYESFSSNEDLKDAGLHLSYSDINQHIELTDSWENSIHKMQQRKLSSLLSEGFEFRKMEMGEMETAHKFLTVCRQAQGLQINISWEHLKSLVDKLPECYECFGVFREGKISALCITVNVTADVAYYYLPATSPMFRNQSPMVLLIAGMVDYYRSKNFKYLDLGVSSIMGKPQEALRIFKERMGAVETRKPTFSSSL